jgi:hypothetical protein
LAPSTSEKVFLSCYSFYNQTTKFTDAATS